MTRTSHKLAFSVDLDEWFHSRRWINGGRVRGEFLPVDDRKHASACQPRSALAAETTALLSLLDRHRCRCTFFVLGEVAERYPDLVVQIAGRGHEIGCHGFHHIDMTLLGPERFERHVARAAATLARLTGSRPRGFRAPNLVYEPWATAILERQGFLYDSTVCRSHAVCGKYRGWANSPPHPYRPSYEAIENPGDARLVELPLTSFPVLKLPAGSGIATRMIGYWWARLALDWRLRAGSTAFYLHPWEISPRPPRSGPWLRDAIFMRRTGTWMLNVVEQLLCRYGDQIVTARRLHELFTQNAVGADGRGVVDAVPSRG